MALRKLQSEIDRTLKAVTTGVEAFETTFDKLNHATNATQKDKVENDLKTQIKKLQRMRDQIKAWLGSSDIKDKTALLENRKLIETQMERFKALEKEMKMKAFSKEGLIAQSKLDPAEKAKRAMIDWIGTTTDELSRQIEQTEAEAETLQSGKKKKSQGDRLSELDTLNERREWHMGRLEVVQRMLENGQLNTDQVETIQEDVQYFVEANTEEDFDYDGGIYDELNLQDEEDYVQDLVQNDDLSNVDSASIADTNVDTSSAPAPPPAPVTAPAMSPTAVPAQAAPKTPAKEEKEKKTTPASRSASQSIPPPEEQPPSPVAVKKQILRKSTIEVKPITASPSEARLPSKPVETAPAPKPAPLPPIRYAAAAAAAVASITPPAPTVPAPTPGDPVSSPSMSKTETQLPTPPAEADMENVTSSAIVSSPAEEPAQPEAPHQANGHAPLSPPGLSRSPAPVPDATQSIAMPIGQNLPSPSLAPGPIQGNGSGPSPLAAAPPPGYPGQNAPHAESSRAASFSAQGTSPRPTQGVLGNLMQSFDMAKELSERRANDVNELHAALDASYANAPQQIDAEPPRYYHPKNAIKTPPCYPQTRPPVLDDKSIYSRLDMDQLFYIFYYMTGTYEQWLAARELKRQSWRFHKQYLTWFQRAHNPQAITEDYEQGGYFYFDWENSWCQRKKSDFRFEYRWLSDH